ncbi:MAG: S41 family peptidase [Patescibacteria group bacterium]
MNRPIKKGIYIFIIFALLLGIFTGGVFFGYSQRPEIEKAVGVINKDKEKPANIDFEPFWKTWNIIDEKFASSDGLDNQKKVWGAIEGMVNSLGDPYSTFFPPGKSKMFEEDISGNFEGVGMEITVKDGALTIVSPLKNSPAEKAGLKPGDKILKINDEMTVNMTSDDAAQLIRGPRGTKVKLLIVRESKDIPFEVEIVRDVINIPVLNTESKPGGIFIIKLYNFGGTSTTAFRAALREFILSGNDKLILDLRNNPGGYLEAAVDIASWFLPAGKIITKETFATGDENVYRSKGYDIFNNLPIVILINNGSASASEILAGALQEYKTARLVGVKTFGKGSVQELIPVTKDTSLKLTIAQWLTPDGKSISKGGLEPNIKVEMTEKDKESNRDPQMDKAIEILMSTLRF